MLMIKGNSAKNIKIKNIIVDGSQSDYYKNVTLGNSIFNMATLIGCTGLTIENCTFKNGCNDAILINKCSGVNIDTITVNKCGHDGVYVYSCSDVNVKNSNFINRTNCSCRYYSVNGGSYLNNKSTTSGGGGSGLQFQGSIKNVVVQNNYFRGLPYPGIYGLSATYSNVKIMDNKVEKCKSPGISGVSGAYLKNNIII